MPIELTKEQQDQLDRETIRPAAIRDPRSNLSYVLLPVDQYEQMIEIVDDDLEQRSLRRAAARSLASRLDDAKA
jgi:hypothetical protein